MRRVLALAAFQTVAMIGLLTFAYQFIPPSLPGPAKVTIEVVCAGGAWYLVTRVLTLPMAPDIPLPPPGRRFATVTPHRPPAFHKTLQEAKNALRPRRARRWAQRMWPEGSVYEWRDDDWRLIYTASSSFTRRGI
jgi:hypothetical protein